MPQPINRWIICFTGWHQEGRLSGLEKIEDAIHRQCNGDDTRVLLKSWKDSPADLASRIWNRCPEGHQPAIVVIGYSYGGYTAVLLARELDKRGLKVEMMLLIDPVWRPFTWIPSVLSMLGWWTIDVPSNVRSLHAWHQNVDLPSGHTLIVDHKTLCSEDTLNVSHQHIDDAPVVFNRAMAVACPEKESS